MTHTKDFKEKIQIIYNIFFKDENILKVSKNKGPDKQKQVFTLIEAHQAEAIG